MTKEELEVVTRQKFEERVQSAKKGEAIEPGFWLCRNGVWTFEELGQTADMLNSGDGKDRLFATMRIYVEARKAEACLVFTEAFQFTANEKADTLPGGWEKHVDRGFKTLVKGGYGTVDQILWVYGQTPEWSVIIRRKFQDIIMNGKRKLIFYGQVEEQSVPENQFYGRTKMFGKISEPEVQHFYDAFLGLLKKKAAGE